jgi:hypothetical protein
LVVGDPEAQVRNGWKRGRKCYGGRGRRGIVSLASACVPIYNSVAGSLHVAARNPGGGHLGERGDQAGGKEDNIEEEVRGHSMINIFLMNVNML